MARRRSEGREAQGPGERPARCGAPVPSVGGRLRETVGDEGHGILRAPPEGGCEVLRAALYAGTVFLLPPSDASRAFADAAEELVVASFGPEPRAITGRLRGAEIFAAVGRMRRAVFLEPRYHALARACIDALGFDDPRVALDPARLRAVLDRGHENPAARAAYFGHRDTWYGNPACVVTVWIPLSDLPHEETFFLYPQAFARPLANDSDRFDYPSWVGDDWGRKIGWQASPAGVEAPYPTAQPDADLGPPLGFAARRAECLVFSGSHVHATRPITTGRTRFSLDFRFVHLDDAAAGRGAPDPDNRSRGSALHDYVHPGRPWPPPR